MTIACMAKMKELSDDPKLSVRSAGEVFEAITSTVSRMKTTRDVMYWTNDDRPKVLTQEAFVNAAILYIDSLPYPEKVRALNIGIGRLRTILGGADSAADAATDPPKLQHAQNDDPPSPPRKRRKSG